MQLLIVNGTAHADPVVQIASLSDLFFNYDHPAFDAYMNSLPTGEAPDEAEEAAALLMDAADFADCLQRGTGITLAPDQLVEDFMSRR